MKIGPLMPDLYDRYKKSFYLTRCLRSLEVREPLFSLSARC